MKKWLLIMLISAFLGVPNVHAEEPLELVKRYVTEINKSSSPERYSKFWREKVRIHLHGTHEGLQKEFNSSVKMHALFLLNGDINAQPMVSKLGRITDISYTFKLSKPIDIDKPDQVALLFPEYVYKEFQVSVEKELGIWKISGETFIGEKK